MNSHDPQHCPFDKFLIGIGQLNNVPQLGQYEGNILDTFNFSTEEIQEKLQHWNIYKSTGPDMLHPRILHALEDKLA